MALTSLTSRQRAAVAALVEGRRIDEVPADGVRSRAFMEQAEDRVSQLALLTSAAVAYGVAYDAAHDVGEALLAAYGFRTSNGLGQHEALGRFLRAVLDTPPGDKAATQFDRLPRARNRDRYEARPVGQADADRAARVARDLVAAARARGVGA